MAAAGALPAAAQLKADALLSIDRNRATVIERITGDWGAPLEESNAGIDAAQLRTMLEGLRADHLLAASLAGSLTGLRDVLVNVVSGDAPLRAVKHIAALGDANQDLVYTPVTPCRLFDTRTSQGGLGRPSINVPRTYGAITPVTSQGGPGGCAAGAGSAVALIQIGTLSPAGSGFLQGGPEGALSFPNALLLYQAGDQYGTSVAMPLNPANGRFDLVEQFATADLYGDLLGYFRRPTNYTGTHVITGFAATDSGGTDNTASGSYSTVGGGTINTASSNFSVVGGGYLNTASRTWSTVSGGQSNTASGTSSTVSGGQSNTASGGPSTISGGRFNNASATDSTIGGGTTNSAGGISSTVAGGVSNTASLDTSTVGGGTNNTAGGSASTVAGGASNTASGNFSAVGGGRSNTASGDVSIVGGGQSNTASSTFSTVAGGGFNTASGPSSTVAGGASNTASGTFSTVAGGLSNTASGDYSFAAGRQARTFHIVGVGNPPIPTVVPDHGAFVFADSNAFDFRSVASNEFAVRATGGVRFVSAINVATGAATAGVSLAAGAGAWASLSDRDAKQDFEVVDADAVLTRLAAMPIHAWRYRAEVSRALHVGPTAQDFRGAFGLGDSDKTITTIDAAGIALAAIQGLNAKLDAQLRHKDAKLDEQTARIAELERDRAAQAAEIADLRRSVEVLLARTSPEGRLASSR